MELFRVGLGDEMCCKWIEVDEKYKKKLEKLNKYNIDNIDEMSLEEYFILEEDVKEVLIEVYVILLDDEKVFDKCYV